MKQVSFSFPFVLAAVCFLAMSAPAQVPTTDSPRHFPWQNASLAPDQRADLLLKELTLDEKILLLHGGGVSVSAMLTGLNGGVGYITAIPRLGIPEIQMADSAYGVTRGEKMGRYSTALPNNLAAASSWDPQVAFDYGALIGREVRDQGYNMALGGGVNLTREPRDGRTFEYQGEDPLLAGTLAGNLVKGVQSQDVIGELKHFALNDQESGRDSMNVRIGTRAMRESDLLAFQIALNISDAGAVMCSYNRVNGEYACENKYLLSDVLKKDWGFQGFVLSDWGATHSAAKASHAGLDMEQPGQYLYGEELKSDVERGLISQEELNDHVHRILRSMFAANLFEKPAKPHVPDVQRGLSVAQRIAEKSIVLLKNEDEILPLDHVQSIAVIGGHADVGVLSGGGSAQVDPPGGSPVNATPTINGLSPAVHVAWMPSSPLNALRAAIPNAQITYDSGDNLASAKAAAKAAQVVIVFAYQWEAESADLTTLDLATEQNNLIQAVAESNKRVIVVLETGGPATMPWLNKVAGVVEIWYPGIRGGEALAQVLTGSVNPSGKLAITFPRKDTDLPHPSITMPPPESKRYYASLIDVDEFFKSSAKGLPPFDVTYDEGLQVGYKWYDSQKKDVLFPFGFGLSYTAYQYSAMSLIGGSNPAVAFTVKNSGKRPGTEIAQVYASLPASAGEPPNRLVGWVRVELAPGESKRVTVPIPRDRLTIYNEASKKWQIIPGTYALHVGGSSRDLPLEQVTSF